MHREPVENAHARRVALARRWHADGLTFPFAPAFWFTHRYIERLAVMLDLDRAVDPRVIAHAMASSSLTV